MALDFSPAILLRLEEQLTQLGDLANRVELLERSAHELEGFAENSFDTLIINSVAQHFPSLSYLNRVMENAIHVVRPGGHIFVGDQRSLPLLETFALSMETAGAIPDMSAAELSQRIRGRIQQEQQLVLSPSFFLSIGQRNSKVSSVEIYPRRGVRDNEMTRFRFDAILRIGPRPLNVTEIPFPVPPEGGWTLEDVRSRLTSASPNAVGFARIHNPRIARDACLLALLTVADSRQPVAALCRGVDRREVPGIHPQTIVQLAAETGYEVALSWASCHSDGSYDAAFIRQRSSISSVFPNIHWPQPAPADFVYYANAPGQAEIREKLVGELVLHCRSRLPVELLLEGLYIVDSFPNGNDGAIDFDALLSRTRALAHQPT